MTHFDAVAELNAIPGSLALFAGTSMEDTTQEPVDPMGRPLWEVYPDLFLNPFAELPPVQTWALMGDRPAFPKEGIVLFKAKPKQGKSFATYAALIPLLTGATFSTITPLDSPSLVIVFDAEMSRTTLSNRAKSLMGLLGQHGNKFVICPLKGTPRDERLSVIKTVTEKYSPAIIVIDQAAELVTNINSQEETSAVMNVLTPLSIGRTVFAVIHENKRAEDTEPTGTVGSALRKAQAELYSVKKDRGIFTVTPVEARDTETDGAPGYTFTLDSDGRITDAASAVDGQRQKEKAAWINNFARIFGGDDRLRRSEIAARLMAEEGLEKRSAETKITAAVGLGVLVKESQDHRAPYILTRPEDPDIL